MQDIHGLTKQIFKFFKRAKVRSDKWPATPCSASYPSAACGNNFDFIPRIGLGEDVGYFAFLFLQISGRRQPCIANQEYGNCCEDGRCGMYSSWGNAPYGVSFHDNYKQGRIICSAHLALQYVGKYFSCCKPTHDKTRECTGLIGECVLSVNQAGQLDDDYLSLI